MHYHKELQVFDEVSDVLSSMLMLHFDLFKSIVRLLLATDYLDRRIMIMNGIFGPDKVKNFMTWFRNTLNSSTENHRQCLLEFVSEELFYINPELASTIDAQLAL